MIIQLNDCDKELRNLLRLRIAPKNIEYNAEQQEYYDSEEKRLLGEKKDIKKKIDKADKKQEEWFELSKDTFDFACYAKYRFEVGDVRERTHILSKLGSNLTIMDRNLAISGDKAFFLIEKGKKQVQQIIDSLEPAKRTEVMANLLAYEPISQSWRRGRDLNPR